LIDVLLLTLFGSTANQDDDLQTILGQVDAQPRTPIDLVLTNAAKPLDLGKFPLSQRDGRMAG
jgi:Tfp pilus assembly protein PilP